ncbi:MAG TPA: hypothetical protein VIV82_12510, partial [Verrucomicrobiae bacterium]
PAAAPAAPRPGSAAPIATAPRPGGVAQHRPMAAPVAVPTLSPVDTILAIAAGVVGVIAVLSTMYLAFWLK